MNVIANPLYDILPPERATTHTIINKKKVQTRLHICCLSHVFCNISVCVYIMQQLLYEYVIRFPAAFMYTKNKYYSYNEYI